MTVQQVLVSLTMFDLLFYDWQQLPFTCSYTPGKRSMGMVLAGYFAILAVVVPVVTLIVRAGSEFTGTFLITGPVLAAVWMWARLRRLEGWGEAKLLYEDLPSSMPDLGIRELTWGPALSQAAPQKEAN